MGNMITIIVLFISTFFAGLWLLLHIKYKNEFADVISSISEDEYKIPELFYIGFGFLQMIKYDFYSEKARKKIKDISEVRGQQYAKYYYYIMLGAKCTYFLTIMPIALLFGCMTREILIVLLAVIGSVMLVWYMDEIMKDKLTERREELMRDFPKVLSKMTLLVNSGMIMREAWQKVAENGEGVIYDEMRLTLTEQQMGITELDSYKNFADRCNVKEIRRFISTLIQNMQKGNAEMTYFLKELTDEMWEFKKANAKKQGETANSKLLLPTALIFMGILAMIMAPLLQSM